MMPRQRENTIRNILIYAVFIFYAFIVIYPIFSMVNTSFKTNLEIFKNPNGLPSQLVLDGFEKAFVRGNFLVFFRNSVFITIVTVTLVLVITSLAAYALGTYQFRGNSALYFFFLVGVIIPIRLGVLNLFELIRNLGLMDNLLALIFIYTAMSIPLAMLILTPLVRRVPRELIDAVRIDGGSTWAMYYHVVLPLIRPALATVAILTFLPIWNDFFFPLIFIRSDANMTVPLGVATLFGQFQQDLNTAFSVLTLATLPAILFYLIAARQFIRGVTAGAIKG